MKRVISLGVGIAFLLGTLITGISPIIKADDSSGRETVEDLYNFREAASWLKYDEVQATAESDGLRLDNAEGKYGNLDSNNGFVKKLTVDGQLTDRDKVRLYIKNPGEAVDFRLQFADSYNIYRSLMVTIAGGSSAYVAYDFPVGEFAAAGDQTGSVGSDAGNVHKNGTLLKDDEYAAFPESVTTYRMMLVFLTPKASCLYLDKLQAVRLPEEAPVVGEVEDLYDFRDAASWLKYDEVQATSESDGLRLDNAEGKYGNLDSNNGFVKKLTVDGQLTDRDKVRLYIKNSGEAVDFRLQFADSYNIYRSLMVTIAGGSSAYVAYDFPVGEFAAAGDQTGSVGSDAGNVHKNGTLLKDDEYAAFPESVTTYRMMLVFLTPKASCLYLGKLQAVRLPEEAPVVSGEEDLYDFREAASWLKYDEVQATSESDGLRLDNAEGKYGNLDSNNGFVKKLTVDGQLTDRDKVRLYIKNPGEAVDFRLQFADSYNIYRSLTVTIAGGSSAYVAYDFPVGEFAAAGDQTGAVGSDAGNLHKNGTLLKDDEYAAFPESVTTYRMMLVFLTPKASCLYLDKLQAVRLPEGGTEEPDPLEIRDGEPEHEVNYDPLEDFEEFENSAAFANAWKNESSNKTGVDFELIRTTDGGQAGMFTLDGQGTKDATYRYAFQPDEAREKYDKIRLWARGQGRLFVQLCMPVEEQANGAQSVSFVKELSVGETGGVFEIKLAGFSLPYWWTEENGCDESITLDVTKLNGVYLVCIADVPTEMVVDNLGWVEAVEEEMITREGEPAHDIQYEVIEDFNSYTNTESLWTKWKDSYSSLGAEMQLVHTTDGGKAARLISDAGGKNATYEFQFPASEERAGYDKIRIWTKGDPLKGTIYLQLNMKVERQASGSTQATFMRNVQTIAAGQTSEMWLSSFSLPEWWNEANGYDPNIELDITKVTGMFIVVIANGEADFTIDNIGFLKSASDVEPDPEPEPEGETFVLENFDGYADNAALRQAWRSANGAPENAISLAEDPAGGKMLKIAADDMTAAYRPVRIGEDRPADFSGVNALRLWAKGNGETVTVRVVCPVEPQEDGTDRLTLAYTFAAPEEGGVVTAWKADLSLPAWWTEENGYDPSVEVKWDRVVDFAIETVGGKGSAVFVDAIELIGTGVRFSPPVATPEEPESPGTGVWFPPMAAVLTASLTAVAVTRKKRLRTRKG